LIEDGDSARCPVCGARFREATVCSRCGANLEPLMLLLARSYELREEAAQCILAGDFERAQKLASEAQQRRFTRRGADLERLTAWLLLESGHNGAASSADAEWVAHNSGSADAAELMNSTHLPGSRASITAPQMNVTTGSGPALPLERHVHDAARRLSNPILQPNGGGQTLIWCSLLAGIIGMGWATLKALQWVKRI
jgi:hypothetical protein